MDGLRLRWDLGLECVERTFEGQVDQVGTVVLDLTGDDIPEKKQEGGFADSPFPKEGDAVALCDMVEERGDIVRSAGNQLLVGRAIDR